MPTINELNAIPESPVTVYLVDSGDDDPATPDARIHCTQYAAAVINGARIPLARNKGFRVEVAEDDATIAYLPVFVNRLHAVFEHPADEPIEDLGLAEAALHREERRIQRDLLMLKVAAKRVALANTSERLSKAELELAIRKGEEEIAAMSAELRT